MTFGAGEDMVGLRVILGGMGGRGCITGVSRVTVSEWACDEFCASGVTTGGEYQIIPNVTRQLLS
jgi:hypothetical protein